MRRPTKYNQKMKAKHRESRELDKLAALPKEERDDLSRMMCGLPPKRKRADTSHLQGVTKEEVEAGRREESNVDIPPVTGLEY